MIIVVCWTCMQVATAGRNVTNTPDETWHDLIASVAGFAKILAEDCDPNDTGFQRAPMFDTAPDPSADCPCCGRADPPRYGLISFNDPSCPF